MPKDSAENLLRDGLKILELPATEEQINQFLIYLAELKKWNRAYSLTALRTDEDIIIKHFLDSLLFLKVLPSHIKSVADIGSGAGFPGIPMKIMSPGLAMTLIEPVQKKVLFLEHMQRTLHLAGFEVKQMRIEDVKDLQVDAVVTRALFSVAELIRKGERLLREKGVLILSKGPKVEDELKDQEHTAIRQSDLVLPIHNTIRHLVIVEKSSG